MTLITKRIIPRKKSGRVIVPTAMIIVLISFLGLSPQPARAATRDIIFPVIGSVNYYDDFGAPRVGHTHQGNDIMGKKMMPLVAAADGTVRFVTWPERDYGYLVSIEDVDGYQYWYLHINNDHPGTDDNLGGGKFAYAPGMKSGNQVVKGQLIGWVGDSGNAERTTPHLHFEIHDPSGTAFDPYQSLIRATHITKPAIAPAQTNEIIPFGEFSGGANTTYGNVDRDPSAEELIVGAGPGSSQVRVYNVADKVQSQFFAYDRSFHGGVDVAADDLDGDGIDEIITGAGPSGSPEVKIFNADGVQQGNFFAFDPGFRGGVRVAAADLDGDGKAEIIVGAGAGMEPRVRVYNQAGIMLTEFNAYLPRFRGGTDVAAIAATDTSAALIVTGAGPGGGPDVKVFTPAGVLVNNFYAYDKGLRGGVHVDVAPRQNNQDYQFGQSGDLYTSPEIFTVPAGRGGAHVRGFDIGGAPSYSQFIFEKWWSGGYDVAAAADQLRVSSGLGGRRATVVNVLNSSSYFRGYGSDATFNAINLTDDAFR